jgi:hypothetical protein
MTYHARARLCAYFLVVAFGFSSVAHAQPTQAEKDRARALFKEGHEKLQAGEPARALPLLKEAHDIMHVPTTGYDLMQAYAELDKLVDARAIGEEIQRQPKVPDEPEAFAEARTNIDKAIKVLDGLIPTITVHIQGPPRELVRVTIDGKPLTTEQIEKPYRVNRGNHRIVTTAEGYDRKEVPVPIDTPTARNYDVDVSLRLVPPVLPAKPPTADPRWVAAGIATTAAFGLVSLGTSIGAAVTYESAVDAYNRKGCGSDCEKIYAQEAPRLQALSYTWTLTGVATLIIGMRTLTYARPKKVAATAQDKVSMTIVPPMGGVFVRGEF